MRPTSIMVLSALCARLVLAQEGVGFYRGFGAAEARIQLNATAFERGEPVGGTLLLPLAVSPTDATLAIRVTDSFGRLLVDKVEQMGRAWKPAPTAEGLQAQVSNAATALVTRIPFTIAVPSVQVMRHYLSLTVTDCEGAPRTATASFIYRPSPAWDDYVCAI